MSAPMISRPIGMRPKTLRTALAGAVLLSTAVLLFAANVYSSQLAVLSEHISDKLSHGYVQIVAQYGWCEARQAFTQTRTASSTPYRCEVERALAQYKAWGYSYGRNLQDYKVNGDWLNFSETLRWFPGAEMQFDSQGLPLVNYGGRFYYNPVTVSLGALSSYGQYLRGDQNARDKFFVAVARLLEMQDSDGAFRYQFAWKYRLTGKRFQPGWVSGMAQGLVLSVMARAYHLTGDPKYLAAGDQAFQFLVRPVAHGGVMDTLADLDPALSGHIIFEEYVAEPSSYTLNGFMYALLGVYDWSYTSPDQGKLAASYFQEGVETLHVILPRYDIGGFTTYDLGHITYHRSPQVNPYYHSTHVYLLHALVSVTGDEELRGYEKLWASYVPR